MSNPSASAHIAFSYWLPLLVAVLLCVIALVLVWRARLDAGAVKVRLQKPEAEAPKPALWRRIVAWARGFVLTASSPTRKEWLTQRWVLLTGESQSGKSSVAQTLASQCPFDPEGTACLPEMAHARLIYQPQGVVLDAAGANATADRDSPAHAGWMGLLARLSELRSQRPLDAVVMCVSARTLTCGDEAAVRQVALLAGRQLDDIAQQTGQAVPVYVLVTQCDAIDGFDEFWSTWMQAAQTSAPIDQMWGCSADGPAWENYPSRWLKPQWSILSRAMTQAQLQVAASHRVQTETGNAADQGAPLAWFNHPESLDATAAPLGTYLEQLFKASVWPESGTCRGVYFTGHIADVQLGQSQAQRAPLHDLSFVRDFFARKVFSESGLTRALSDEPPAMPPVQQWRLRLQTAFMVVLCLSPLAAAYSIQQQFVQTRTALQSLLVAPDIDPETGCVAQSEVDHALAVASATSTDFGRWYLPWSWFSSSERDLMSANMGTAVMSQRVLPALVCELERRATALTAGSIASSVPPGAYAPDGAPDEEPPSSLTMPSAIDPTALRSAQAALILEEQAANYQRLIQPQSMSKDTFAQLLASLYAYAFTSPAPHSIETQASTLQSLVNSTASRPALRLPAGMKDLISKRIEQQASQLQKQLLEHIGAGPILAQQWKTDGAAVESISQSLTEWLTWVQVQWVPATATNNQCLSVKQSLLSSIQPLITQFGYPSSLGSALDAFNNSACYQPARQTLADLSLAPYGRVVATGTTPWQLNPALATELAGMQALQSLPFMQLPGETTVTCLPSANQWRTVDLGMALQYASQFEEFLSDHSLTPVVTNTTQTPLFQQIASAQLSRVLNKSVNASQRQVTAALAPAGTSATSTSDQLLLTQSSNFAQALQPLLNVVQTYHQSGFATGGANLSQCARQYASNALGNIALLSQLSRQYQPDQGPQDGKLFNLGSQAVLADYLSRQIGRAGVLVQYATPFTDLLANTTGTSDTAQNSTQTLDYWQQTEAALTAYVQFKEPSGPVGQINSLFTKTLAGLNDANCEKALTELPAAIYANDLFSQSAKAAVERAKALCNNREAVVAFDAYQAVATRFANELAGKYPFADASSGQDADLATVKSFFTDYAAQRGDLDSALASVDTKTWADQLDFIKHLDETADFFAGSLVNAQASQPVTAKLWFHYLPSTTDGTTTKTSSDSAGLSPGANQIANWSLSVGNAAPASFPGAQPASVNIPYGTPLSISLVWASQSAWRPKAPTDGSALVVEGPKASWSFTGPWALVRMLETLQPQDVPEIDPLKPSRALLELKVPATQNATESTPTASATSSSVSPGSSSTTVAYIALDLSAPSAPSGAPTAGAPSPATSVNLTWPGVLPRTAPTAPVLAGSAQTP